MSKYIDAERLKKIVEQERQLALEDVVVLGDYYYDGRADAFGEVLLEIKSLQEEQPKPEIDLEKVWDWIDENFREAEIDSRYGDAVDVVMSSFDTCKSDLRKKFESDFGLNARKEE